MSPTPLPRELALPDGRLLEAVVTTTNEDGAPHIRPMGPIVDSRCERIRLRPFRTSTTFGNLKRTGVGVLHVTDDVELIAQAAIGKLDPTPQLLPAVSIDGWILADACRWYAFQVTSLDDRHERTEIQAEVVDQGRRREFFGFNRAKHAVLEAAILATRLDLLPPGDVATEFERLTIPIEKTGGHAELRAFALLKEHVLRHARTTNVSHPAAEGQPPLPT